MTKQIGDLFHSQLEGDVEFGGIGAEVAVGGFWGKLGGVFKSAAKGLASSGMVKDALNSYSPGLGDAAQSGMKLIEAGSAGDPAALAQIKAIADVAATGDPAAQKTNELLKTLAAARKTAAVEVGKTYVVTDPRTGQKKKFKSKAAAQAWMKAQQQPRPGQRPGQQSQPQRRPNPNAPVTQGQVASAMTRVPPQRRPQLANAIQQAQLQGRAPVQPAGAPPYGSPGWYAWQQQNQGYPYGMQQGYPYGYGAPGYMQDPYSGMYADEGYFEQDGYYGGDPDEELAAAFAGDESFPDDGIQGENAIAYRG